MCTCRQMAKFASEKRRFGEVALHAKFKHVAIQFAHRGITHGEGRLLQHTDVFKVLRTCRQMAKFANEKRRFGGCYLAHKIETRCHTICTPCITYGERTAKKAFFKRKQATQKNLAPSGIFYQSDKFFRLDGSLDGKHTNRLRSGILQ